MRSPPSHPWFHILLFMSLAVSVPLLQGTGLHLHVGDSHAHELPLHPAQHPAHVLHHNDASEVDLTPQTAGTSTSTADFSSIALPVTNVHSAVTEPRAPRPLAELIDLSRPSPPWRAPPLRGPPA